MKTGVAVTDLFSGLYAAIGILAAVHAREATGRGQHLDLSLFDSQVAMLANQAANYLVSGIAPQRLGNSHPNVVPYQSFATCDGHIVLAVGNDEQFHRCCRAIGREDLAVDSRYQTNGSRAENRDSLVTELALALLQRNTADWLSIMEMADVPCAPINRLDQVFEEPQALARSLRLELAHPLGTVPLVASPIRLSETPPSYRRPPPLLGQHTEEVLVQEIGLDAAHIASLRSEGVIR
jgi:crotonobetainyl-CoA:carnitine CoA-transferase CaiB-like acyl-CoA transferase